MKQQDQRQQQQAAEQEKLKRLKEIAESQEAKLKKVRALKGHVEQKRLSNGKLGELLLVGFLQLTCASGCAPDCASVSEHVGVGSLYKFVLSVKRMRLCT